MPTLATALDFCPRHQEDAHRRQRLPAASTPQRVVGTYISEGQP